MVAKVVSTTRIINQTYASTNNNVLDNPHMIYNQLSNHINFSKIFLLNATTLLIILNNGTIHLVEVELDKQQQKLCTQIFNPNDEVVYALKTNCPYDISIFQETLHQAPTPNNNNRLFYIYNNDKQENKEYAAIKFLDRFKKGLIFLKKYTTTTESKVNQKDIDKLKAVIRNLNTDARIIPISKGNVSTTDILSTGLFDFARAQQAPGWLKELRGEHTPETEEYGISSFVYKARRPFYPKKFHDFLHSKDLSGKLIRSKGYFWLATRPQFAGNWSQAGGIAHHGFAGMFWKAIPKSQWPTDKESIDYIKEKWVEPFGDMRQELVFIGQGLDQKRITKLLDECLLSDSDLLLGKDYWAQFPDPFPEWGEAA